MAKSIPLPKLEDLPEVVLFHRSHPSDQRILLHVPTGAESAETYPVRLNVTEHKQWFDRLPNSQTLKDRLSYEMHVCYYPHRNGTVMNLADPDELPWVRVAFAGAHVGRGRNSFDTYFRSRGHRHSKLPQSSFRSALRGGRK